MEESSSLLFALVEDESVVLSHTSGRGSPWGSILGTLGASFLPLLFRFSDADSFFLVADRIVLVRREDTVTKDCVTTGRGDEQWDGRASEFISLGW